MGTKYSYSFVVYAYNQQEFVSAAVRAALLQDCQPIEVILSDDCSTDDTFSVMRNTVASCDSVHQIVLNRNERNLGTNAHLDVSHDIASGDIIIAAAGDDISHLNRARRIIDLFENSNALLVHSMARPIDQAGQPILGITPGGYLTASSTIQPIVAATAMALHVGASAAWHKELFNKYGPIVNADAFEDLVLGFRAVLEERVGFIEDQLLDYRVGLGRSHRNGEMAVNLEDFHRRRLHKHKIEGAVLEQRLVDCRTFGLNEDHPIALRIQHKLRNSTLAAQLIENKSAALPDKTPSISRLELRVRLRELVALIKWRVRTFSVPNRKLRL